MLAMGTQDIYRKPFQDGNWAEMLEAINDPKLWIFGRRFFLRPLVDIRNWLSFRRCHVRRLPILVFGPYLRR